MKEETRQVYVTPRTKVVTVNHRRVICSSGGAQVNEFSFQEGSWSV